MASYSPVRHVVVERSLDEPKVRASAAAHPPPVRRQWFVRHQAQQDCGTVLGGAASRRGGARNATKSLCYNVTNGGSHHSVRRSRAGVGPSCPSATCCRDLQSLPD